VVTSRAKGDNVKAIWRPSRSALRLDPAILAIDGGYFGGSLGGYADATITRCRDEQVIRIFAIVGAWVMTLYLF
jgi:hypothetical protein